MDTIKTLAQVEAEHIKAVFDTMRGNVSHTAVALGLDRRTTYRKLRALGLKEPGSRQSPWNDAGVLRARLAQLEAEG